MFYISYGCSFLKGTAAFRVPWGLQMLPAIFLFFALIFLPESPRWLAKKDRWEDSVNVLALVHAKGDVNSPFVQKEMAEIREVVEFERANSDVTYLELLTPKMINRTHIGVFTQIWSQLTGMNVMMCKLSITVCLRIQVMFLEELACADELIRLYYLYLYDGRPGVLCAPPIFNSSTHPPPPKQQNFSRERS